jgi:predicted DNA-binding transcriptional regulator YafY
VERDIDLRNWLFGFGAGNRIDSPEPLRDEHRQKLQSALEAYQSV